MTNALALIALGLSALACWMATGPVSLRVAWAALGFSAAVAVMVLTGPAARVEGRSPPHD